MVGLPWEQHVTFLDDPGRARSIVERVAAGVRACAGHPAVLCYVIGNEIPAPIVRWHGHGKIERFLELLYRAAKAEDPDGLVTYVNYPSTEYLALPFVDLVCFNVYLEDRERLEAYLARLQNLAGDRPLVLAEVGLDSRRNGEERQAEVLDWQIRAAFGAGCAGVFVFAWTDEWHRGGAAIEDWDFGLTRRDRTPKPALGAVRSAFAELPFSSDAPWPSISVVICTHNGSATIREPLEALRRVDYPELEVIVVDDGSTDATADIAAEYEVRLVRTENRGLSSARNTGLAEAQGEIVAYLDDDAWPDPHWLRYLGAAFARSDHAAIGGPNVAPLDSGPTAEAVALAPGGPIHVLLSDVEAEHIPGCNMAVRRDRLEAIGGFDPQFRVAGDDVDVCWRLQERGWTLGFSPAALVWHRRRASIRAYWRQQENYGKAEALLERKYPERYNALGHVSWSGRVYGGGLAETIARRVGRIYHGTWGTALFQSIYQPAPGLLRSLPMMPDWYLLILALGGLSALGALWRPLLLALPLLALAVAVPVAQTLGSAASTQPIRRRPLRGRLRLRAIVALLHFLQPLARLSGRLKRGLTPWRRRGDEAFVRPTRRVVTRWSETWRSPSDWILEIEEALRAAPVPVVRGGDFDRWDLAVRSGVFASARLLATTEEHGGGRQLARFRIWPRVSPFAAALTLVAAALAVLAAVDGAAVAAAVLALAGLAVAAATALGCAHATAALLAAARREHEADEPGFARSLADQAREARATSQ
jgi:O-antigen biosynthesis protein